MFFISPYIMNNNSNWFHNFVIISFKKKLKVEFDWIKIFEQKMWINMFWFLASLNSMYLLINF